MKRTFLIIALILVTLSALPGNACNRWSVYGGANISHVFESYFPGMKPSYNWGTGAFIGAGYEIKFSSYFSLTPQLELSYIDNGAIDHSSIYESFYAKHCRWMSSYNLSIPIIANFRIPISDKIGIRLGCGPYIQESLYGRHYTWESNKKVKLSGNIFERSNIGAIGEIALDTGSHISYMFRAQHPFPIDVDGIAWIERTLTLSLGIRYTF